MLYRSFVLSLALASSSALSTPAAALRSPVSRAAVARPQLRLATVSMEETFPTLEEELEAGKITQEEYDALMGGDGEYMDESEYEEELEAGVLEEKAEMSQEAQRVVRGMKSESGVEFAPWMKIDAEAIAKAKKEREARKAKQAMQALKSDSMLIDPQAAELGAGGGLKSSVLSQEEVELRWDTADEVGNAGFIVQRRRGGAADFSDLETYESFAPLRTKGPAGGTYVYLDDTADVGTWVYRILDCDTSGTRSAVCQKLVEIESKDEQQFTVIVGGVIFGLALALGAAGTLLDPIQTTSKGASFF